MELKIIDKIKSKAANPDCNSPIKIAFLGDSVTHGCFEVIEKSRDCFDCIYDHDKVYHHQLKRKIETSFPNVSVNIVNAGISGGNAIGGSQRVKRDIVDSKPDLAVICFGLNDVLFGINKIEQYKEALRSIFQQLKEAKIDAIFMTPNMMCPYVTPVIGNGWLSQVAADCAKVQNDGTMDEYMNAAKFVCAQQNILLCDCYRDWKQLEYLGADITWLLANHVNHPTREMHTLFAEKLYRTIIL